eukprot:g17049.t1
MMLYSEIKKNQAKFLAKHPDPPVKIVISFFQRGRILFKIGAGYFLANPLSISTFTKVEEGMLEAPSDRDRYGLSASFPFNEGSESDWSYMEQTDTQRARRTDVDMLRGAAMVLMTLSTCCMFFLADPGRAEQNGQEPGPAWFGQSGWWQPATGLIQDSSPGLAFLTQQATQLAPPAFFLLLGVGVRFFYSSRLRLGWSHAQAAGRLATRGALLMLLSLVWVDGQRALFRALRGSADSHYWTVDLSALWSLGCCMVLCAGLAPLHVLGNNSKRWLFAPLPLGDWLLATIATLCLALTQLLVPRGGDSMPSVAAALTYVSRPPESGDRVLFSFPFLAWLPFSLLGMLLAPAIAHYRQRKLLLCAGVAALLFAVLRMLWMADVTNLGSLRPHAEGGGQGLMYFFALCNSPPDFCFACWSTALCLSLLALFTANFRAPDSSALPSTAEYLDTTHLMGTPHSLGNTSFVGGGKMDVAQTSPAHYSSTKHAPPPVPRPRPAWQWSCLRVNKHPWRALCRLGQAPLVFYLAQLWLVALMAFPFPAGSMRGLGWVYFYSVLVIALLYPLAKWWGLARRSRSPTSFWRFF